MHREKKKEGNTGLKYRELPRKKNRHAVMHGGWEAGEGVDVIATEEAIKNQIFFINFWT